MTNIDQLSQCAEKRVSRSRQNDKTKISFWKRRIFKPTYVRDGVTLTSPNFCVELQHQQKRVRWSLGPANPEVAAAKARDLFLYLISNGWPATLAKYRPASIPNADPSVGAFIEAVQATADLLPRTLASYLRALRKIVADIAGLSDDTRKFGDGRGHRQWIERVHSVKLSALSSTAIQTWKRDFLARAGQDPLSQRSAKVSVNSFLRCAKSLFSPRIIKHLALELPDPLPFAGATFEARPSLKYRSTFDVRALIEAARNELATTAPEVFKVFLLATFAGLRRKEIDLLPWSAFKWDQGVISITPTAHFSAKSEDSYADVAIDGELVELFCGYQARATGPFVIESAGELRPGALYDYYRCGEIFERLIGWLRDHGVDSAKPLHCLRKEFGSMINASAGIHAASRALRHSAVAVTDQFYSDHRVRATVGLGHLLESPKIVEFKQEVA
jgi:hypothetical protein